MIPGQRCAHHITQSWNGEPLTPDAHIHITLTRTATHLRVEVDAPRWHDAPPPHPKGSTPQLWEHEVVELFLLGAEDHYLEVELGPHGHYLVLQLDGYRHIVQQGLTIAYEVSDVEEDQKRWRGVALVPQEYLPAGMARMNAYGIHGAGEQRRYSALYAAPHDAERPDFHRLEYFGTFFEG